MKKNLYRFYVLLLALCCFGSILGQERSEKLRPDIEIGLHHGRTYYGYSLVMSYLENRDYSSRGGTEFGAYSYTVSLGLRKVLSTRNSVRFNLGYNSFGTGLRGRIGGLRSDVSRPLDDDIPVGMEGQINHSFVKLGAAITHSFSRDSEGFYFMTGVDYNLNIKNNWRMLVDYETGRSAIDRNLSAFSRVNTKNPFIANFQLGYNIPLGYKGVFLTPLYQLYLGLGKIHENGNSTFGGQSFGVRIAW